MSIANPLTPARVWIVVLRRAGEVQVEAYTTRTLAQDRARWLRSEHPGVRTSVDVRDLRDGSADLRAPVRGGVV